MSLFLGDVLDTARQNNFLVFDNNCPKNIVFIGACRLVSQAIYFNYLQLAEFKRNIYFIYVVDWNNKLEYFPKHIIRKILENTDIIICENIKTYEFLNTNEESEVSFFKEFAVGPEVTIHRLPNFELSCHSHYIVSNLNTPNDKEKILEVYNKSRERLRRSLIKYGCSEIDEFITRKFSSMKLFYTCNHVTNILLLLLFKNLMKRFNVTLHENFCRAMYIFPMLTGMEEPIFDIDVELHGFTYMSVECDNSKIYDKAYMIYDDNWSVEVTAEMLEEWSR